MHINKRREVGVIQDCDWRPFCGGTPAARLDYRRIEWLLAAVRPCSVGRLLMRRHVQATE